MKSYTVSRQAPGHKRESTKKVFCGQRRKRIMNLVLLDSKWMPNTRGWLMRWGPPPLPIEKIKMGIQLAESPIRHGGSCSNILQNLLLIRGQQLRCRERVSISIQTDLNQLQRKERECRINKRIRLFQRNVFLATALSPSRPPLPPPPWGTSTSLYRERRATLSIQRRDTFSSL